MRINYYTIECDREGCTNISEICRSDQIVSGRWIMADFNKHFCCEECHDPPKPWYDGLCVEVTLADVVRGNGGGETIDSIVCLAGNQSGYGTHGDNDYGSNWRINAMREKRYEMVICYPTGVISRLKPGTLEVEHSPHSIVNLICPTFTEACEHPAEFITMANAAFATHSHLTDTEEWTATADKLHAIYTSYGTLMAVTNCSSD